MAIHFLTKFLKLLSLVQFSQCLSQGDPSGFASVSYFEGKWNLVPRCVFSSICFVSPFQMIETLYIFRLIDWSENDHVIAVANLTNTQTENGWMLLEVQTRER